MRTTRFEPFLQPLLAAPAGQMIECSLFFFGGGAFYTGSSTHLYEQVIYTTRSVSTLAPDRWIDLQPVFPTVARLQRPPPLPSVTFHCRTLAARCTSVSTPCFPRANFLSDDSRLHESSFKWLDHTCPLTAGLAHLDFRSSFYRGESRRHEVVNLRRDLANAPRTDEPQ